MKSKNCFLLPPSSVSSVAAHSIKVQRRQTSVRLQQGRCQGRQVRSYYCPTCHRSCNSHPSPTLLCSPTSQHAPDHAPMPIPLPSSAFSL